MNAYEKVEDVMVDLFQKDYQFALATAKDNTPSVRYIDTYYQEGAFYVVTYALSQKVKEIMENGQVSLCHKLYRFRGNAINIGHPLKEENLAIREKLVQAFQPWYFAHNNEKDENMCYVKIELEEGFVYKDGSGYKVNFKEREVEEFPFEVEVIETN